MNPYSYTILIITPPTICISMCISDLGLSTRL